MSKRVWSFIGLLVVLAGVLAAVAAARPASGAPGLAQALAAKDGHAAQLLSIDGVVGAGVTTQDGEGVLLVLTARDGVAGIPSSLDGVRVVARTTGTIGALVLKPAVKPPWAGRGKSGVDPTSRFDRPVPTGVSTGNSNECAAGTIAGRVKSGSTVYALSNNHVYARENAASLGEEVLQPGRYDTGCAYSSSNHLGNLSKFVHINFSGGNNSVDAAIAQTTTADLGNSTPLDGYGTPSSTITGATTNMAVEKYGRTTSLTHGSVCGTDVDLDVNYGSAGVAHFVNQIMACSNKPFIKAGDSGSLLVADDGTNQPVGLLYAGDSSGKYAFANKIGAVLSALGVSIDGA